MGGVVQLAANIRADFAVIGGETAVQCPSTFPTTPRVPPQVHLASTGADYSVSADLPSSADITAGQTE